jgi:uncharacterized protein involved in outer membrane biogenesis
LKRILIAIAIVWAVVAAGIIIVPRLTALVDYRELLIAQIEARTGRAATIDGDVTLDLLPTPHLTAHQVRIASIPGAKAKDVLVVGKALFQVEPGSLATRKLRITRIDLIEPTVNLEILPDGRRSWDFEPPKRADGTRKPIVNAFQARNAAIAYRDGGQVLALSGDFGWDGTGERPRVHATLSAGSVDLNAFLPPQDTGPEKVRAGGARWSSSPLDLSVLRGADGTFSLKAQEIRYRRYQFATPAIDARLEDGRLILDQVEAGILGGRATLKGEIDARGTPRLRVELTVKDASLERALSAWADTPFATGTFGMTATLDGAGESQKAIVSSLSGTVLIEAKNGVLRGFDAARLSDELLNLRRPGDFIDLADTALGGGQTRYTTLGGSLKIDKGIARVADFRAQAASATATAEGTIDLPGWAVNLDVWLTFTGEGHEETPPIGMSLNGPLESPQQKNRLTAMGKYLGKKLVNSVVRDVLGEDEPRYRDEPPGDRRDKTRRVMNRLLDKLENRRDRGRRAPEDQYGGPRYREQEDGYPPESGNPPDDRRPYDDSYPPDDGYAPGNAYPPDRYDPPRYDRYGRPYEGY